MGRALFTLGVLLVSASMSAGQIIDHTAVDGAAALPQATCDAIGQQCWLFTHASVGGNIMSGMAALHVADAMRYPLVSAYVGHDGSQADPPSASTVPGTIYDCSRGNPGWLAKIYFFDRSVRLAGWHAPLITAALDKMCYIDQSADATTYLNSMAALEADYSDTRFVYATMPLTTDVDGQNVLRNVYNDTVRAYCATNGRLLLDIADIEAHDPNGVAVTFESGGVTYQRLYAGYTSDGGHLNSAGSQRVALGWYAAAAALVSSSCGDVDDDGLVNMTEFAAFEACAAGPDVAYDPAGAGSKLDCDGDADVDLGDFAALQGNVTG